MTITIHQWSGDLAEGYVSPYLAVEFDGRVESTFGLAMVDDDGNAIDIKQAAITAWEQAQAFESALPELIHTREMAAAELATMHARAVAVQMESDSHTVAVLNATRPGNPVDIAARYAVAELRGELKSLGLPTSGNQAELITRLLAAGWRP